MKGKIYVPILLISLVMLSIMTLSIGAVDIDPGALLRGELSKTESSILWNIRLPRLLLVLIIGSGVSIAGAAIQGMFRNPLADPALIGVSSGAALFAAAYLMLGLSSTGFGLLGVSGSALVGGFIATLLVLMIGQQNRSISGMLLAGIAINAICLAGVGLFTFLAEDAKLRSIAFWALGSFSVADWPGVLVALLMLPAILMIFAQHKKLDLVTLGDQDAAYLGVSVVSLRWWLVSLTAILIGISVSLVGIISFVGLVVPHLVRLMFGARHNVLLPMSGIVGALILLLADNVSRVMFLPAELPVGLLTAIVGGPFFVYLIVMHKDKLAI